MANQGAVTLVDEMSIDDPLISYYIHHSSSPGVSIVSQILKGENYSSWSRAMVISLSAKNKFGFLDGSLSKSKGTDPNLLNTWIINNNIAISWILNSVSKEIFASLLYLETAREIWENLKDRFLQNNDPRVFQLKHELVNLRQVQLSVVAYYTKLKIDWVELSNFRPFCVCRNCSCDGIKGPTQYFSNEYVISFLMGLNDSYAQIRSQILLKDRIPNMNCSLVLVSQEEKQRTIGQQLGGGVHTEGNAFLANISVGKYEKSTKKKKSYCTYCKFTDTKEQ